MLGPLRLVSEPLDIRSRVQSVPQLGASRPRKPEHYERHIGIITGRGAGAWPER